MKISETISSIQCVTSSCQNYNLNLSFDLEHTKLSSVGLKITIK